jgi:glucose/arabinose dehydrogenase
MRLASAAILLFSFVAASQAWAQPQIALQPVFGESTFDRPLALKQAPGDDTRFYVIEQPGRVLVLDGLSDDTPDVVLDIRRQVEDGPNEAGLLGMAFDPRFAETSRVFLSYTRRGNQGLESVVTSANMAVDGRSIDPASERIILSVAQPFGNHNGGDIAFGPDDYLYIGFGDGGAGGDPLNNGQNLSTLLGAILRIDVHSGTPYAIPRSNPFRQQRDARNEIFAYGLRNPWRFSFDRETGDLWAGDVGQNRVEEIDLVVAGGNYGWNIREGSNAFRGRSRAAIGLTDPVAQYGRNLGCSVTGGYVYRGTDIADLNGVYLFSDFCSGRIWGLLPPEEDRRPVVELLKANIQAASFGEANDGSLFILDLGGTIYQIVAAP